MAQDAHGTRMLRRREFIALGGLALLGAVPLLSSCANSGDSAPVPVAPQGGTVVYRLSSRGRRTSRAAKVHNANRLFSTMAAADHDRAHPGDTSRIVPVTISNEAFARLFQQAGVSAVDLRKVRL